MVISILMVIVGAVTIATLPVAQFPNIVPPEVQVLATYVGADAQTIEQSVATPVEQQMSGVDNMNYMYSLNSTADGLMHLIVDYDVKTDPNTDLMLTQMRQTQAASQLPSVNGPAAPGYSADQGMAALEDVFRKTMPREMGFDYLGMSFQEKKAQEGIPPAAIFGFSLLFVFLILAALYESWSLPFSVLMSTPVAIFGAFAVLWLRRTLLAAFLPTY